MSNIVLRISEYLIQQNIATTNAEKAIGMSNGALGTAIRKGNSIKSENLEKFLNVYRNISLEWLVYGRGNMLKEDSSTLQNTDISHYNDIIKENQEPYDINWKEEYLKEKAKREQCETMFERFMGGNIENKKVISE